jgi:hypothetical protein
MANLNGPRIQIILIANPRRDVKSIFRESIFFGEIFSIPPGLRVTRETTTDHAVKDVRYFLSR